MANFNRDQLRNLQGELQSLLDSHDFNEACDLDIKSMVVDRCTWQGGEAKFTMKVILDGAKTREQKDLEHWAKYFNLDTTAIYSYNGMSLSLVGWKSKARKMPWIAQDLMSGKSYKLTNAQAKEWFSKEVEPSQ